MRRRAVQDARAGASHVDVSIILSDQKRPSDSHESRSKTAPKPQHPITQLLLLLQRLACVDSSSVSFDILQVTPSTGFCDGACSPLKDNYSAHARGVARRRFMRPSLSRQSVNMREKTSRSASAGALISNVMFQTPIPVATSKPHHWDLDSNCSRKTEREGSSAQDEGCP